MRTALTALTTLGLAWILGCRPERAADSSAPPAPPPLPLLASYHFVGISQLSTNTNAAKLKTIWNLPATRKLTEQTWPKLARVSEAWLAPSLPATNERTAELIRPLLDDLLGAESCGEWRGQTNRLLEWTLAVRLNDERARVWQTNWWQLMAAGNGGLPTTTNLEGFVGWESPRARDAIRFRFLRAGDWTVIGGGSGRLLGQNELLQRLKKNQPPWTESDHAWLEAQADLAGLENCWPGPAPVRWPNARLIIVGKADDLRTKLSLVFPERMNWPAEPWHVPTNTIRDPLISFTAVQGVAPWLSQLALVKQLEAAPVPDQLFVWAQHSQIPVQTSAAMPLNDASNLLEQLATRLPALLSTNLQEHHLGQIRWVTNRSEFVWIGLPFLFPSLRSTNEPGGQFLLARLFPPLPGTNPPPPELIGQVAGRTNLLYYDWEITQERLGQWRAMSQLYSIISTAWHPAPTNAPKARANLPAPKPLVDTNAPTQQWLTAVAPFLGNAVTEVTMASPQELTLVRKSPLSLTGFELVLLTRWLDEPAFPGIAGAPAVPTGPNADAPGAGSGASSSPPSPHAQTGR
ncbi:MAG: hypothetical protein ACYDH9_24890 [Limisphaerales bacterium]